MARNVGLLSFETQDFSNCRREGSTATNIIAGVARSGGFGLQLVRSSAAVDAAIRVTQAGLHTPSAGARFDFRFRYFFKIVTLPSASNLFLGGIGVSSCRLELNTSGQLRLTASGVTGSYAGSLSTGRWYRADHRHFGLWPEGGNNAGRQRAEIAVYDYGTDGLTNLGQVFSDSSQPTPRSTGSLIGTNGGFYVSQAIASCKIVEANLADPSTYFHRITGVLPSGANGDYGQPPPAVFQSDNQINGPAAGAGVSQQGTCVEFGTVLGRQLHDFTVFNTGETPHVFLGQHTFSVGGVSATREIHYDDVYWDWRSGAEADALADWPLGTRAYLFVPTSQGSLDQFTPAGGFGNIDEVPLSGSDSVASTGAGTQSTYDHAALAISTDVVSAVKVAGNVAGGSPHKLLIDASELEVVTNAGFSDQQNENTPYFGKSYDATPLTAAEFLALEFGVKADTSGTFTVKNLWVEALTGPPANTPPVANAGPDQTVSNKLFTTFEGSATDAENDPLTYEWEQISGPSGGATIDDPTDPESRVDFSESGVYVFRLTATDDDDESDSDDVTITVDISEIEFGEDDQTGEVIGLSWEALTPRPSAALQALAQLDQAITAHEAGGFLIVDLQDGDRSLRRCIPVDAVPDPAKLRGQVLAILRQLRGTQAIEVQPHGGERFRLQAAYHEAGHCVAAMALGLGIRRTTIVPGQFGQLIFAGETSYELPTPDPAPMLTLQRMAVCLRVGPMTPAVLLGHPREEGDGADWRQIEHLLKLLRVPAKHLDQARDQISATARAFLHVGLHASQIEAVATALLERRTLSGAEITEICTHNGVLITPWQPNDRAISGMIAGSFADVSLTVSR